MKIILREHVDHLGERGQIVNVASGYARNYLLPKRLAYLATPGNLEQIEHQRRVWASRDSKEISEAEALAARLAALELSVVRKSGESGTLYGSVTNSDLGELLLAKGVEIDRRKIVVDEPIKSIGTHAFHVRLHPKVNAAVKVEVVAEDTTE